ncbi:MULTISPECIES: hypothetical protein [Aerococcus]|uniref:Bacteriocin n=1 Tax=Aerococcus sanguinicola TaxID=119206 RepID=A0A5N1GK72_9LACT|nr:MULTISPECIES: hypothetical protein [Aerococcus]KAA9301202.1 hypothetical protein F6I03_04860 [Aerococcus sanguinicola]MDK6369265.1 hypothetical protein [Aerococcus sp. UMB9870]MDK6679089.1 hypothetical protein [Aerococcus sp. UMB8608]MDK6686996.1 hypothetical protein [Aerococcus sp. UMB8623]MDK6940152.1 hypothetical protein [Aerococcus sp. UMB8487]
MKHINILSEEEIKYVKAGSSDYIWTGIGKLGGRYINCMDNPINDSNEMINLGYCTGEIAKGNY